MELVGFQCLEGDVTVILAITMMITGSDGVFTEELLYSQPYTMKAFHIPSRDTGTLNKLGASLLQKQVFFNKPR